MKEVCSASNFREIPAFALSPRRSQHSFGVDVVDGRVAAASVVEGQAEVRGQVEVEAGLEGLMWLGTSVAAYWLL